MAGKAAIASSLQKVAEQIRREERSARSLGNGLEQILNLYNNTESGIRNNLLSHGNVSASQNHRETGAYHVDSIVFDDDGSYGGNQGNMDQVYKWDPIKCWDLLRDLREYFPNMSVFEAFRYFSRLNSVGCGYVALANTLFMEYANRPQDFERTFGYPMFKDGDLNYDRLILDIYATTDKAGFNDRDDGLPNGTVDDSRAHIVEHFLRDKGVDVETEVTLVPVSKLLVTGRLQYTWQQARDVTDVADTYYRHQIPYIPWHSGSAIVNIQYQGWDLNYSFIYAGERYNQQENIKYNYMQPWYTSDISLSRQFHVSDIKLRVMLEVNNVFSQDYDVILNYPMPKRNYGLTLDVKI